MWLDDETRLRHMLDAGRDAVSFAAGKSLDDLRDDRILVLALIKSIEIVGEAASRVSDGGRARFPDVPWSDVVAMRNRLIHGYYDVDVGQVWLTVREDLPPLIAQLEAAMVV